MKPLLLICEDDVKLKDLKRRKGINNVKYMNIDTLEKELLGSLSNSARIHLALKFNINFELTKELEVYFRFIDINFLYNNPKIDELVNMKKYLIDNNYYTVNNNIRNVIEKHHIEFIYDTNIKRYNYIYKELLKITDDIAIRDLSVTIDKLNDLNIFSNINYELRYVFNDIYDKLTNNKAMPSDINIVCSDSNYYPSLYRIADSYKVSLNIDSTASLISNYQIKAFYNTILNGSLTDALSKITNKDIYNDVIKIINEYEFNEDNLKDKNYQDILFLLLKKLKTKSVKYSEAIKVSQAPLSNYKYIYYLNFNYNVPAKLSDSAYLSDKELTLIGLDTSNELNIYNERVLLEILINSNYMLTYPIVIGKEANASSYLISKYNIKENNINKLDIHDTLIEDKLHFTKLLDNYTLYKKFDDDLSIYDTDYLDYKKYDNSFKPFDKDYIKEHRLCSKKGDKPKKQLSYSSFHGYFDCPFKFYIDNMLELNTFENSIHTRLGNYAHHLLECSYKPDFDYDKYKEEAIKYYELDNKDQVFASIFDKTIKEVIEFNKNHEINTGFDSYDCERKIIANIDDDYEFKGFVDKLLYKIEGNKAYVAIVDYKTGSDVASLNNFKYGANMQLPIYLYLLHFNELFKDKEIILVGMYLQKVNIQSQDNEEEVEFDTKNLKLNGYTNIDRSINNLLIYKDDAYLSSMFKNDGDYTSNALKKLLSNEEINKINQYTKYLIENGLKNIDLFKFAISPMKIGNTNPCRNCNYRRVCYRTPNDYRILDNINIKDFLNEMEDEDNAKMD